MVIRAVMSHYKLSCYKIHDVFYTSYLFPLIANTDYALFLDVNVICININICIFKWLIYNVYMHMYPYQSYKERSSISNTASMHTFGTIISPSI